VIAASLALALAAATEEPRFRVFDARGQSPIADAVVELWTEEGTAPIGAAVRVAVLRSSADGMGGFTYEVGGIRPDNARISRPGYASRTVSTSDLEDGVEMYPFAPLKGRVVDLLGQPVARAVVRTREVCAHAVSAAETSTDEDGHFALLDCPADAQMAELEVLPREHVPVGRIEISTLRRLQARDGSFDIHVAKRAPLRVRVLDAGGAPMAGRRIVCNTEPYYGGWTNAKGEALLPPQPMENALLEMRGGAGTETVFVEAPPSSGSFLARPIEFGAAEAEGRLTLELTLPPEASSKPRTLLIAANGASFDPSKTSAFPVGAATLIVGQDFSPWVEEVRVVEIAPLAQSVAVSPKPAAAVEIVLPEGPYWWKLLVQAGGTGMRCDLEGLNRLRLDVPPGVELVFLAESGDGELRRVRHAGLIGGVTEIDMRQPAAVVRAGCPAPEEREER